MTLRWWARRNGWREMQRLHGFRRGLTNRKWFWLAIGFAAGTGTTVARFALAGY